MKSYKYHSGIWRHKKECKQNKLSSNDDELDEYENHTLQTENVIVRKNVISRQQNLDNRLKNLTAENRQIKMEMERMVSMMTNISNNSQFQT